MKEEVSDVTRENGFFYHFTLYSYQTGHLSSSVVDLLKSTKFRGLFHSCRLVVGSHFDIFSLASHVICFIDFFSLIICYNYRFVFSIFLLLTVSKEVRAATGWTARGSNLGGGEIFQTLQDRPWGPPSFLYIGYRVSFARVKRPGRDLDKSLRLAPRLEKE
jgi:hypothetical protein